MHYVSSIYFLSSIFFVSFNASISILNNANLKIMCLKVIMLVLRHVVLSALTIRWMRKLRMICNLPLNY